MLRAIFRATIAGVLLASGCAQVPEIRDLPQFDYVKDINDGSLILGNVDLRAVVGFADGIPESVDGGLGWASWGHTINESGQVAGNYFRDNDRYQHSFIFDPDVGLIDLAAPDTSGVGSTNNDLGQVFWAEENINSRERRLHLRENDGSLRSINIVEGFPFSANNNGQVLIKHGANTTILTISETAMTVEELDDPDYFYTELSDINDFGQAVGRVATPNKAVIWTADEGLRDLLGPGEAEGFASVASSINDAGLVALTLIPPTGFAEAEFAFYSPDRGLIRFPPPDIPVPAACAPGTFKIGSFAGVGIHAVRDKTLNDSGLAFVRITLDCEVGFDTPLIEIPAAATIDKGIQLLPIPRGLRIQDLFSEIEHDGRTTNRYSVANIRDPAVNNHGKMTLNFKTENWRTNTFLETAHLYNLRTIVYSASELLTELSELVGTLPAEDFLDDQRRQPLLEKIDVISENAEAGDLASLCDAIGELQNDILPKTDGESPPEDWVTDTSAQKDMEALVTDIIEVLQRQADELGGCP